MSHPWLLLTLLSTALAFTSCAAGPPAQNAAVHPGDARLLAIHLVKPQSQEPIVVTSKSFAPSAEIPYTYSDYGDNISPQLAWRGAPKEAKSIVILMEDPDAKQPKPFVHWVLYNLPPSVTSLHEAIPPEMQLIGLSKSLQGMNSRGSVGYFGPRPPYEDAAHHYHFQVFALDRMLELSPGVDRATLLTEMRGHVLSSGELFGTYKAAK